MKQIKFSHEYWKLGEQHHRDILTLLQVFVVDKSDLSPEFIEYDTHKVAGGFYPLSNGKLLVLFFGGSENVFTTVRRWTIEKEKYYKQSMGESFEIIIETAKSQAGD
jgi:hypothetical protein